MIQKDNQTRAVEPSRVEVQMEKLAKNPAFLKKMQNLVRREEQLLIIKSPYALSDMEVKDIKKNLGVDRIATLRTQTVVDPSLILGIVVTFKDYYFDYSLKGQFARLYESLRQ